jgi:hypothetical protein
LTLKIAYAVVQRFCRRDTKTAKEFKMTKKSFLAGMFCLALVCGLLIAGCDSNDDGDNPFVGTWTGGGQTVTITASTWEMAEEAKGTYTRNGNTATLTPTHYWDDGEWVEIPAEYVSSSTVTVSGNTMSGVDGDGNPMTLTKS